MLALVLPSNRLVVYGAFRSTVFRSTERLAGSFNSKTFSLGCRLMSCMPPHLFACGVGCVMTWLPDDLFMAITCTSLSAACGIHIAISCVWHAHRAAQPSAYYQRCLEVTQESQRNGCGAMHVPACRNHLSTSRVEHLIHASCCNKHSIHTCCCNKPLTLPPPRCLGLQTCNV